MDVVVSIAVLSVILVVADWVSEKSKGLFSALFVSSILLMLGNWFIFDNLSMFAGKNIADIAGVNTIGNMVAVCFLVHMGTMISVKDFLKQWKIVICGFMIIAVLGLVLPLTAKLFLPPLMAYCGTPLVAGAAVANIMMQDVLTGIEAAKNVDLNTVKVFCILILALQNLIGIPLCSVILKKDAKRFLASPEEYNTQKQSLSKYGSKDEAQKKKIINCPSMFRTPLGYLSLTMVIASIGYAISTVTGQSVFVINMILGLIFTELGLLPDHVLDAAQSCVFINLYNVFYIIAGIRSATPELVLSCLKPLLVIFILGVGTIALGAFISSLVTRSKFLMTFSVGLTALFGAPGTLYVSQEVSKGSGRTDEEKEVLLSYIMPKMVIAGFSTLTIGSVVLAGVLVPIIEKLPV